MLYLLRIFHLSSDCMSIWSMPFGLIQTLQHLSPPSPETFVSLPKHCRRSCIKFTGELSTCSGTGCRGSDSGCSHVWILPQLELCSGLCCVDDARSESRPLQWCHQSWVHAGGYHPGVGAHHPFLHIIYQQTWTILQIFAQGRTVLKARWGTEVLQQPQSPNIPSWLTFNTKTPRKDWMEQEEFVKGQKQDRAALCSWLCSAAAELRLKVYHNCLLTQVRSLKDIITPLCRR